VEPALEPVPSTRPLEPTHLRIWPKRLPRELAVPQTTLWFNLEVSATRFEGKAAYLFFGRPTSFGELRAQALAIAGWLESVGVKPATGWHCSCRIVRSTRRRSTASCAPTPSSCRSTR